MGNRASSVFVDVTELPLDIATVGELRLFAVGEFQDVDEETRRDGVLVELI